MKYIYIIKEYLQVAWQCLTYIYKFDKKGTVGRLAILLIFPVIANILIIANAKLADSMQQNFGSGVMNALLPIFLIVIGIEIIEEIFTYLHQKVSWIWKQRLTLILDVERLKKKNSFTLPFIESRAHEEFNQRVQNSSSGFNAQISVFNSLPDFFRYFINIFFSLYIITLFNPLFGIALFLSALPRFVISLTGSLATRKHHNDNLMYIRKTYTYSNQFNDAVNLKDTKSSGTGLSILDLYASRKEHIKEALQVIYKKYLAYGFIANIFSLIIGFILQYFVIRGTLSGTILIGQATLIILQGFKLQSTVNSFSYFLAEKYTDVVSAKYISLYLSTKENMEKQDAHMETSHHDLEKIITMKNIVFSYPEVHFEEMRKLTEEMDNASEKFFGLKKEEEVIFRNKQSDFTLTIPSLTIKRGERVAIVGKNGNGKTTFLQLLLNLYQPEEGEIKIFGNVIKDMNQREVQKYFSMLFQDYGQTNFKVSEYIGLSDIQDPDIERVKKAAQLATASEFIEKWKDNYTQQLGIAFKGVKPSKGQWQKLAVARALYKDAPILVLDEPTAAIDAVSAKKIFENLATFDPEKILIFVCHNMVDIPLVATRVLVFDKGVIVGDGTHTELLKTCKEYKELYDSEVRG